MTFFLKLLGSLAAAIALGLGSAYLALQGALPADSVVKNGPWATNLAAGGTDAGMYTRAAIAIGGLLALSKEETIYYGAREDSAGEALDPDCAYRIEGRDPGARWWSITAYGDDHFLIDHPAKRYSVSKTSVVRNADGTFVVRVSATPEAQNWIATSPDGFQLTLRLYNPAQSVIAGPAETPLPAIVKEACS